MTPVALNSAVLGPASSAITPAPTTQGTLPTNANPSAKHLAPAVSEAVKKRVRRERILKVIAPIIGILLAILVWEIISKTGKTIPGPLITWNAGVTAFSSPFYVNGPNDQGIGFKIVNSLARVGLGFGLAALVGIPLGFMIGRFSFLNNMLAPIISILRPVSPLAWLPIGLLVFQGAQPAAIWTIFISSIWPMIINTAVGVQKIPQDYMNVAKVLNLSEWRILTKILIPATLPYVLTGVRLAIGVAWLVIVAAEMLTGGVGIGFWVWDEWNNLKVENILLAIVIIGIIGMLLEWTLLWIAKRFSYGQ
jgi:nitrate/nitrite transport system permease protein